MLLPAGEASQHEQGAWANSSSPTSAHEADRLACNVLGCKRQQMPKSSTVPTLFCCAYLNPSSKLKGHLKRSIASVHGVYLAAVAAAASPRSCSCCCCSCCHASDMCTCCCCTCWSSNCSCCNRSAVALASASVSLMLRLNSAGSRQHRNTTPLKPRRCGWPSQTTIS